MHEKTGLNAIKAVMPLSHLAKALGITRGAISQWKNKIPAERIVEIERITGIKRSLLRPDLFDNNED